MKPSKQVISGNFTDFSLHFYPLKYFLTYPVISLSSITSPCCVRAPLAVRDMSFLEALDEEKLLKDCGENFFVEPCCECEIESKLEIAYKEGKKAFGFVGKNKTAILTLKDIAVMNKFLPDASPALKGLDVSVLHTLI